MAEGGQRMERSELYQYLRGNRAVAAVCALVLLAVPTAATLFPGLVERTDRGRRILIMVVWLLVAAVAAVASQTRRPARPVTSSGTGDPSPRVVADSQRRVLADVLRAVLDPRASGIPTSYSVTLSMADSRHRLFPWFPVGVQDSEDPRVLDEGQGVTGSAYADRRMTCAVGEGVTHETLGLTPAQQQLFAPYRIVVAVPVQRVDGAVMGALTVMAAENDGTFVSTDGQGEVVPAGQALLEDLAGKIGVALAGATELDMT
jgi:hypothetical protein